MNSKEALEHICNTCDNKSCPYIHYEKSRCVWYGIIKQSLDRLEKLEQFVDIYKNTNKKFELLIHDKATNLPSPTLEQELLRKEVLENEN